MVGNKLQGFLFRTKFPSWRLICYRRKRVSSYRSRYSFICSWEKRKRTFLGQSGSYYRNYNMSLRWATSRMINTFFMTEPKLPLTMTFLRQRAELLFGETEPEGTWSPDCQQLWGWEPQENAGTMHRVGRGTSGAWGGSFKDLRRYREESSHRTGPQTRTCLFSWYFKVTVTNLKETFLKW